MQHTWSSIGGDALFKLKGVRDQSLIFNRDTFGNIFRNKRRVETGIRGIHNILDSHLFSDLIQLEKTLQREYSSILAQEELLWYQKSRENWVRFGNKNTKFFHAQTVVRRRRNKVVGLDLQGIWCYDEHILKQEAHNF